uniref:Uncharacterized protein n=1 Tax=virus sp. ctmTa7 TaxID=2828255 RepID=A0A8S5RCP6_9VIRU|nr:MAG TPA: hypothetical protein [virus sp. ctmTa7]
MASLSATPRPLFLVSETYYTRKHNIPVPFSFIPTHGIPCLLSYRDKYYHLKKDETAIKLSKNNTFIAVDVLRPTKQKVYQCFMAEAYRLPSDRILSNGCQVLVRCDIMT